MKFFRSEIGWVPFALLALFLTAVIARPPLPVDETRYLTVAWEMFQRGDWFAPLTLNYEPYHHKPPLLFWLINISWSIFGVSRWAATIPVVLAAAGNLWVCGVLARVLFPERSALPVRSILLMTGSIPFLMYGTMIMFDISLSFCVLAALVCLLKFERTQNYKWLGLMALAAGAGVLMKGPVAYLYILPPMILAPFWAQQKSILRWLGLSLAVLLVGAVPVLLWLANVLQQSDKGFAFWLVWNQTAGRVSGNFNDAHNHPFYFYLPLLPVLILPWALLPEFWKKLKNLQRDFKGERGLKFLACWFIPVFVAFTLISGKQPHYLVPLLPAAIMLLAYLFKDMQIKIISRVAIAMVIVFVAGQGIAAQNFLRKYDVQPVVDYIHDHPDKDWAFAKNYHGEFGFAGRLQKPIEEIPLHDVDVWFAQHPQGHLIVSYKPAEEPAGYEKIMEIPYKGKILGIFKRR